MFLKLSQDGLCLSLLQRSRKAERNGFCKLYAHDDLRIQKLAYLCTRPGQKDLCDSIKETNI